MNLRLSHQVFEYFRGSGRLGILGVERKKNREEIEEQIAKNQVHPWIRIMKERSRYNYKYKDDSLLPVSNKGDPDCSIEITTLKLKNTKNCVWWSIGIDLFAGKNHK